MALLLALLFSVMTPAEKLRDLGTQQYQQKNYAAACETFQSGVKLDPQNADLWADLGVCLTKLKKNAPALSAQYKAIQYGHLKTRLHAYYNLNQLGVRVQLPPEEKCQLLKPPPGCDYSYVGCTRRWETNGAHLTSSGYA